MGQAGFRACCSCFADRCSSADRCAYSWIAELICSRGLVTSGRASAAATAPALPCETTAALPATAPSCLRRKSSSTPKSSRWPVRSFGTAVGFRQLSRGTPMRPFSTTGSSAGLEREEPIMWAAEVSCASASEVRGALFGAGVGGGGGGTPADDGRDAQPADEGREAEPGRKGI